MGMGRSKAEYFMMYGERNIRYEFTEFLQYVVPSSMTDQSPVVGGLHTVIS